MGPSQRNSTAVWGQAAEEVYYDVGHTSQKTPHDPGCPEGFRAVVLVWLVLSQFGQKGADVVEYIL